MRLLSGSPLRFLGFIPSVELGEMTDDRDRDEALERLARTQAKLSRHERRTGIILAILSAAAVVALGLLIGHVAGAPWLSHSP